jgi:hypothetical protein
MNLEVGVAFYVLLLLTLRVTSKDIYISVNGTNNDNCGSRTFPCSIQWPGLRNGQTGVGPNDRFLFFDGVYDLNSSSTPIIPHMNDYKT